MSSLIRVATLLPVCLAALATSFTLEAGSVCEQETLTSLDGAAGDDFGGAVTADGDLIVVGAPEDDDAGSSSGSVYVFRLVGGTWVQEQKLTALDADNGDDFGFAVDVSGDTIVVGAPRDDTVAGNAAGSIYVFRHDGATWSQEMQLFADDAAANDRLGHSVSISGDTLLAGAINVDGILGNAGAGYVFLRSGVTWSQQAKLTAAIPQGTNPHMGHAVDLSGDLAVLGAWQDSPPGGSLVGAAHVFRRVTGLWSEQQKLSAADAADFRWFGQSVAIDGSTIVVGAYGDRGADLSESGGVYIFDFDGATWIETVNLNAVTPAADDRYGWFVAIEGDRAMVGSGTTGGRAWLLSRESGPWVEACELTSDAKGLSSEYGYAVGLSGATLVVGDRGGFAGPGTMVVFSDEAGCGCPWDLDGRSIVGITDLLALLAAWGPNPGHPADFDLDEVVGITDLLALLANWGPC